MGANYEQTYADPHSDRLNSAIEENGRDKKMYRSDVYNYKGSLMDDLMLNQNCHSQSPPEFSSRSNGHAQGLLTTHVWPKSRMLFAVVSKMSKEGVLNNK